MNQLNIQFGITPSVKNQLISDESSKPKLILKDGYFILTKEAINLLEFDFSKNCDITILCINNYSNSQLYVINSTNSNIPNKNRSRLSKSGSFRFSKLYDSLSDYFKILEIPNELELENVNKRFHLKIKNKK
jgi:hypothetical protein